MYLLLGIYTISWLYTASVLLRPYKRPDDAINVEPPVTPAADVFNIYDYRSKRRHRV